VRLYKGEDFKLTLDDFAFSFVNSGDLPDVEFCVGSSEGVKGQLVAGNDLVLNGTNLYYEDDIAVAVKLTSEDGVVRTVSGDALASKSADLLVVPAAAITPLELTNGKWKVTVERTTSDGKKLYGKSAPVLCVGFGPTPGPQPIAMTSDGKCKIMTFRQDESATTFNLGNAWEATGEGLYGSGAPEGEWQVKGNPTLTIGDTTVSFDVEFGPDGTSALITSYGDSPAAGTYENVELLYTVKRVGDEAENETLTIVLPTLIVE
jgi:hypothetical protein